MRDDERKAIGLGPAPDGLRPDPEANAIRWFWRVATLFLLAGVVLLWVRIGDADRGVGELTNEMRVNRAFTCRVLYAQGELEPNGPCYSDEIYPLWEEYAVSLGTG